MGFLDNLKKFGLNSPDEEDLYNKPEKKVEKKAEIKKEEPKKEVPPFEEKSAIFDKKYTCPVCDMDFTSKTLKTGKIRPKSQDVDLRNVYEEMEPLKYDVISCPKCGYSALTRFYGSLTEFQINEIKSKICANYKEQVFGKDIYSYDEAKDRYELAIANAIARQGKNSEKAYLCLKMAWLIRSETEHLDPDAPGSAEKKTANKQREEEFLKKALDGFVLARQKETPPIAGMDELTLEYLMAALGMETQDYDLSMRLLGNIIVSRTASGRLKEKAKDLKDMIAERKNKS